MRCSKDNLRAASWLLWLALACLALAMIYDAPAFGGLIIDSATGGGVPSCDDCSSGDLTFSWHMEGTDNIQRLTVTNGTPPNCGCVKAGGDTTAELVSEGTFSTSIYKDGGASLYCPSSLDSAYFTNGGLINSHEGTIEMWVRIDAWVNENPTVFHYFEGSGGTNTLRLYEYGTSSTNIEFRAYYDASTMSAVQLITSNVNGVQDTWYRIVLKWRTGAGDPNMVLYVYNEAGELLDSVSSNTDLLPFTTEGSNLYVGTWSYMTVNEPLYIDGVKIWSMWQD